MSRFHRPGASLAVAAMAFLVTFVMLSVSSRSQTNHTDKICLTDDTQTPCPYTPCAAGSYYCGSDHKEPGSCSRTYPRSCILFDEQPCGYRYKCSQPGVPFDIPIQSCAEQVVTCVSP
jgi:hypothetical protein